MEESTAVPLQVVGNTRLYRQIAEQLSQLIASGEFAPGARLPAERELASALGVSRASVREAIISLEIAGLIEVRVGTGIFVTAPSPRAASAGEAGPGPFELLAARSLVEGEIAALAAREAAGDDLVALDAAIARMVEHNDDFAIREDSDREFHLALAAATGNSSLSLVVAGLWDQRAELWRRMQHHYHTPELALQTIRDHKAIAAAVRSHDPDAARRAMHRHLARVTREFQREGGDEAARPAASRSRKPSARAAAAPGAKPQRSHQQVPSEAPRRRTS
ncbi:MAG: FadR family transcriptional regulator [Proteobacteria bacterium]|nr:FadR family transcriptional regulator [Pseudomonadota bacterium]